MSERTVAIVGRPNVGKSALFNRLAKRRISIVHDMPGVTRDRITTKCKLGDEPFTIIDTGGIGSNVDASFSEQVHAEVDIALGAAHLILFVVDAMDGLSPIDQDLARRLRRADKPILLVVNKIDDPKHQPNATEFTRLGFKDYVLISAEHGRGIGELVQKIEAQLPAAAEVSEAEAAELPPLKIAIVGRPNVGKSSLTNAILNDARTLVSPISGTTRDAIDIPYERHGNRYILIDTAGIRARTRRDNSVEVFSAMRSEDSIRRADLCCLVIDATMGITMQDKKIAGLIQEAWRPCIIVVNKWDLIEDQTDSKEKLKEVLDNFRSSLFFLNYAPLLLASAKTGAELTRLFKSIERVHAGAKARIGTGPLNRLLQAAMTAHPPGSRSARRFKMLYATQSDPKSRDAIPLPEFVFFVNDDKLLDPSYKTYLEKQLRAHTPYEGIPLRFVFRARKPGGKSASHRENKRHARPSLVEQNSPMAFSEDEIADHTRLVETLIWSRYRPPVRVRDLVTEGQRIAGHEIELFFLRPKFLKPNVKGEHSIAKFRYIRTRNIWRLYRKRADLKWHDYEPYPEHRSLAVLLQVVADDAHGCFWG